MFLALSTQSMKKRDPFLFQFLIIFSKSCLLSELSLHPKKMASQYMVLPLGLVVG